MTALHHEIHYGASSSYDFQWCKEFVQRDRSGEVYTLKYQL